jgi:hypothetical protein
LLSQPGDRCTGLLASRSAGQWVQTAVINVG